MWLGVRIASGPGRAVPERLAKGGFLMTPQLDGGLDFLVLFSIVLVALLLRRACRLPTGGPARPVVAGLGGTPSGIVLGLVLGVGGGLLLVLTVLSLR